ncbi:hypothetical protein [Nostoc sp.]
MLKPHLNRYWLNANPKNPETFKQESNQICQLYQQAQELSTNNIHIVFRLSYYCFNWLVISAVMH